MGVKNDRITGKPRRYIKVGIFPGPALEAKMQACGQVALPSSQASIAQGVPLAGVMIHYASCSLRPSLHSEPGEESPHSPFYTFQEAQGNFGGF